ncbi:hypothetical protein SELMODRAFT_431071 [Selaginella moellendorffii]|uniref:Uncharacterized protein n=1 Tax=Selaginella moellendorffii TaxID=88036 RepID=D8TBD7_SELML|nr:hypothetical protein SELMODRAFT_431071 [Selaginella moellendorffii]
MSWGVRFGPEAVRDKIDFLMSMDIHYRHVAVMLKAEPHILQVDNAVLKQKLDFLFKGMKLDVEELLKCPAYLSKKSMDRVKIRWKVLSLLKSRGIIQRIHLKDMVTLPRKWFVETFVFKYPDCGRVDYGERSALKQARAEARGERSTCSLQALATQDRLTSDLSPCELRALRISPWIVRKPWIHSWLLRGVHQNKKENLPDLSNLRDASKLFCDRCQQTNNEVYCAFCNAIKSGSTPSKTLDEDESVPYVTSGVAMDTYVTSPLEKDPQSISAKKESKDSGSYFCKIFCGSGTIFSSKQCRACPASAPSPAPSSNHH